jgi:hypothetical protein
LSSQFHDSYLGSALLCIDVLVLGLLVLFVAVCLIQVSILLMCKWYDGSTEGNIFLNSLNA